MAHKKYSPGMIILSYLLSLFVIAAPIYLYIFRPKPLDFQMERVETPWTGIITLWDVPRFDQKKGTNFGWMHEKISLFEKKYPGVYIEFTPMPEKGEEKLEAARGSGQLPDIIPIGRDNSIITKNILEPLNDYFTIDEINKFNPSILNAVKYNDQVFAVPWMINTYTMILNLEIFRERGVAPPEEGKWTYEEFVEKLQLLTFDSRGRERADHFGFNGFIDVGYFNMWGIILSDGAEIFDSKGNYTFNDEKAISGVQKLIDLKQNYKVTPSDFGEKGSSQAWTSFYKEQNIAVFPVGTWGINAIDRLNTQGVGFEYTIASFPIGDLGEPIMMSSEIGAFGIRKQEDLDKVKMCVEFLKFLSDDIYQGELHRLGAFPVKNNISNIYEGKIEMGRIQEHLQYVRLFKPHSYSKEIDQVLQAEILLGVLGQKSAEDVVRDADIKIKEIIK